MFVNSQLPAQQLKMLSVIWSAKEAMYKWYGEGAVDFSEMMRIFPFPRRKANIDAASWKGILTKKALFFLHYKLMEELDISLGGKWMIPG